MAIKRKLHIIGKSHRICLLKMSSTVVVVVVLGVFSLLQSSWMDLWSIDWDKACLDKQSEQSKTSFTVRHDPRRNLPLVLVGGVPRSGTTLLRVLLDAHPSVRCGPETHLVPKLLFQFGRIREQSFELTRLKLAGIDEALLDSAAAAFFLEVILGSSPPIVGNSPSIICKKDPLVLIYAKYFKKLFPKVKFVYLVRDGRAVVHSIITRKVTITGFNLTDYRDCLMKWNRISKKMYYQCRLLGESCLQIHYEKLVLNPQLWLNKVLHFLELPWSESMLSHDKLIKNGSIKLSILERSTEQVIRPISTEALTSWVGHIPLDVLSNLDNIAPMLRVLGYDPNQNPPNYGLMDRFVAHNMKYINETHQQWQSEAEKIINSRSKLIQSLQNIKLDTDTLDGFREFLGLT